MVDARERYASGEGYPHETLTHASSKKLTRAGKAAEGDTLDGIGKEDHSVSCEYREPDEGELGLGALSDLAATRDDLEAERAVRKEDTEADPDHGADDVGEPATDKKVGLNRCDGGHDDPDLREH